VSVEVCCTISDYFLRIASPSLSLGVDAGMGTGVARRDNHRHHLAWVLVNRNLSAGGLLHRIVAGYTSYLNYAGADGEAHAV
jgi:hypothetical protein